MRRRNVNTNEKEMIKENLDAKKKTTKIDKRKLVSLIISLLLLLVSIASVITLIIIDMLPFKYIVALILGLVILNGLLGFILLKNRKGKKTRLVINILQGLFIILQAVAIVYVLKTFRFMNKMTEGTDTKKENYLVVVLKNSKYAKLKDLDGKVIEYYSNELDNSERAIEMLKEKIDVSAVSNEDVYVVAKTLLSAEVDAILLEESQKLMLDEELEGFLENTKVIHTLAVDISVETIAKEAAVASEPFIVYISGIDTYGKIASVSRSDVNMVAVINPKTYQVLLVNIPRDYYVQLHGTSGKRDKLTHAGMYGVERSVTTIEDLLKIDINYYFKVNFTSLIDVVNSIGGIEVNSEYSFTDYVGQYSFVKGINKLDGAQALAFARERKAFSNGDRMRGKNQQAVLSAIVDKASTPSIITKFDSLLKSLSDKFQTNMTTDKMMELVKLQISKMPTWNISTVSLTGADARAYAYSSGSTPLYVMLPSQNSINDAMAKIKTIMTGGALEGAYDSVTGNVTSLRTIEIPVVEEEKTEEIVQEPVDEKENDELLDGETGKDKENGETTGEDTNTGENTGNENDTNADNKEEGKNDGITSGGDQTSTDTPSSGSGNQGGTSTPSTDNNTNTGSNPGNTSSGGTSDNTQNTSSNTDSQNLN